MFGAPLDGGTLVEKAQRCWLAVYCDGDTGCADDGDAPPPLAAPRAPGGGAPSGHASGQSLVAGQSTPAPQPLPLLGEGAGCLVGDDQGDGGALRDARHTY